MFGFADKLLESSISVIAAARVTLNKNWARDPSVVGLTLLSRSITNFRAALILLRDRHPHVIEARVLARCIYENFFWIAALRERRLEFVKDMLDDDAASKQALGELTLKLSSKYGGDIKSEDSLLLRSLIKGSMNRFPERKKLRTNKVARQTVVELAYVEYARLSIEAVHCSVTALGRHLDREELNGNIHVLNLNVVPKIKSEEVRETLILLCRALQGVTVGANELLGFTDVTENIAQLMDELEVIAGESKN